MKKLIFLILAISLIICGCDYPIDKLNIDINYEPIEKNNLVSYNGNLKINGVNLQNQYNENIQLRGMSSHGIHWFGDYINYDVLKELRDNWNTNVFRVAMYTAEGGYLTNPSIKNKVIEIVDNAIALDMYVIIDWHILHDNNPNHNTEAAKTFFKEMASLYHDKPNVIYEICNEPNGNVTWDNDIKPYADTIITEIRKYDDDAIIIVGTPNYSQDVDVIINNRINDKNVMYALHFYAGTHKDELMKKAQTALNNNIPLFVSEWGTSDASGNGGFYKESSEKWLKFLNTNNISWINWSLCDKNESSAALKSNTKTTGIFDDNYLSESGKFIKEQLQK